MKLCRSVLWPHPLLDFSSLGQPTDDPSGGVPVEPSGAMRVEEHRPLRTPLDRQAGILSGLYGCPGDVVRLSGAAHRSFHELGYRLCSLRRVPQREYLGVDVVCLGVETLEERLP